MNNYPSWWNTTVTIFNKFIDPQTQLISWYKTVVEGCFWKDTGNKITINNVVLETNNIICRIRKDAKYLDRYEWESLANDLMSNYFTLSPGDIIIKGNIDDTINEYQSGKRATDLLKKYKSKYGCLEIQAVSNNTNGGRGNEHYYVTGI